MAKKIKVGIIDPAAASGQRTQLVKTSLSLKDLYRIIKTEEVHKFYHGNMTVWYDDSPGAWRREGLVKHSSWCRWIGGTIILSGLADKEGKSISVPLKEWEAFVQECSFRKDTIENANQEPGHKPEVYAFTKAEFLEFLSNKKTA